MNDVRERVLLRVIDKPSVATCEAALHAGDKKTNCTLLETASYLIIMPKVLPSQLGTSPRQTVTVILHGEIYGQNADPDQVAAQWETRADAAAADFDGSYILVIVDCGRDQVSIVTDRTNSRRAFWAREDHAIVVSADLLPEVTKDRPLDAVAVASYLANGVIFKSRSLFTGVSALRRASVHRVANGGLDVSEYWTYNFASSSRSFKALSMDLGDLILEAVKRRTGSASDVFLSLSGGFDSSALCAVLARFCEPDRVKCFSYSISFGLPEGSDEQVAAETAKVCGFRHLLVKSYQGDFINHLQRNAACGGGFTNPCDEVDGWSEIGELCESASRPVIFVGDECMGWTGCRLRGREDVFRSIDCTSMRLRERLLRPLLGDELGSLFDTFGSDCQDMWAQCPGSDDLHNAKDYLYLDQRIVNLMMLWRERFAGRMAVVRNPLLDGNILDFMRTVPSRWRKDKLLYRYTVSRMFPNVFRIRRARRGNYLFDVTSEITKHVSAIEMLIHQTSSRLDEIVPVSTLIHQLRSLAASRGSEQRPSSLYLASIDSARWMRSRLQFVMPPFVGRDSPGAVLRRALILRMALAAEVPNFSVEGCVPG